MSDGSWIISVPKGIHRKHDKHVAFRCKHITHDLPGVQSTGNHRVPVLEMCVEVHPEAFSLIPRPGSTTGDVAGSRLSRRCTALSRGPEQPDKRRGCHKPVEVAPPEVH